MKIKKNNEIGGEIDPGALYICVCGAVALTFVIGMFLSEQSKQKTRQEALRAGWTIEQVEKLKWKRFIQLVLKG